VPYVKSRKLRGGPERQSPRRETPHRPGYDKFDRFGNLLPQITPVSWSFDGTPRFGGYLDSNGPTAGGTRPIGIICILDRCERAH